MNKLIASFAFLSASAMLSSSSYSQVPAVPAAAVAAPAPPTLWQFLGIPQGVKKVQGALTNRRGNLPKLEPKDAIKALNDPRNLVSDNKAIKKAAELKIQEDLKPQKIKAIKYLTSIGCGCYDKGGEVTAALIAAAEDCTEDVRLTVMQEVKAAACGKCCSNCGQVCCCNEKMLKKLAEIAFERDDTGCYKEASARVRQAAAEALRACLPNNEPPCIAPEEPDAGTKPNNDNSGREKPPTSLGPEGSSKTDNKLGPEGKSPSDASKEADDAAKKLKDEAAKKAKDEVSRSIPIDNLRSSRRRFQIDNNQVPSQAAALMSDEGYDPEFEQAIHSELESRYGELATDEGVVISFDASSRIAHVHFLNRQADLRVGDEIAFDSSSESPDSIIGHWKVVYVHTGCIRMVAMDERSSRAITPGQHMMLTHAPEANPVSPVSFQKH